MWEAQTATLPPSQWAHRAYEAFAPVYDDFTAHHDYKLWLGNLLAEARRPGLGGRRLLDVGCGTGKSSLPMLDWGWRVTACDLSASMVELARSKVSDIRIDVADMRQLPAFGEFDLVWALGDAMNYLLDPGEFAQALDGMCANLAPSGLLVFDVNTLAGFRTFFAETVRVEREQGALTWRGQSTVQAGPGSINEACFEVERPDGSRTNATCVHRQRHFPEAEVLRLLKDSGLKCLSVFGHGYDAVFKQPLDELTHTKAVYIARSA